MSYLQNPAPIVPPWVWIKL